MGGKYIATSFSVLVYLLSIHVYVRHFRNKLNSAKMVLKTFSVIGTIKHPLNIFFRKYIFEWVNWCSLHVLTP